MRILTYNIHGWRTLRNQPNLEQVAAVIAETEADLVGLNEVYHPVPASFGELSALETLAQSLGMHFVFGPCVRWPATAELPARSFGNALLSRWPIIASAGHHLTPVDGKEQRGLLEARILLPNQQTFTAYVTHLDHTDEAVRQIQLRAVHSWTARDRNRPHVLMGDFNAISPWDYQDREEPFAHLAEHPKAHHLVPSPSGPRVISQMEKAGYTDVIRLQGKAGQSTYIPAEAPLRIDYIWVSHPLVSRVRDAQIWQGETAAEASDHWPVLADVAV